LSLRERATLTRDFPARASGWAHFRLRPRGGSTGQQDGYQAALRDGAGNIVFGLWQAQASGTLVFRWHGNTADDATAVVVSGTPDETHVREFDFFWIMHGTVGILRGYLDGVLTFSVSGNTVVGGGQANIASLRFAATGADDSTAEIHNTHVSQMLVSTRPTVGAKVWTLPITGAGDLDDWTGDPALLAGTGFAGDSDVLVAASAGDDATFEVASLAEVPTGHEIVGLAFSFSARTLNGGITQLRPLMRLSSTTYTGTLIGVSGSWAQYAARWQANPATGARWTIATVEAAQPGVEAVA
jgi:hypothetical protein